jgi:hypothetical protein
MFHGNWANLSNVTTNTPSGSKRPEGGGLERAAMCLSPAPSSGVSSPTTIRNNVVLPDPLGPTRPIFRQDLTETRHPRRAPAYQYCLSMFEKEIILKWQLAARCLFRCGPPENCRRILARWMCKRLRVKVVAGAGVSEDFLFVGNKKPLPAYRGEGCRRRNILFSRPSLHPWVRAC